MVGAPGGAVQSGGVAGDVEVGIAFGPEGVYRDTEVEESTETFEVLGSGEVGEEGPANL
jgi:hypothetical protein